MTQLLKIPTDLVVSSLTEELLFSRPTVKKEVSIHSWTRGKLTKLIKLANIKAQLMALMFKSCALVRTSLGSYSSVERKYKKLLTAGSVGYLSKWVMISGKGHCHQVLLNVFLNSFEQDKPNTICSIIFQKRQTSLWPISPKLTQNKYVG